jgi:hypothetical protein
MKKITLGIVIIFLAFLVTAYLQKQSSFFGGARKTSALSNAAVSWNIENGKKKGEQKVTFTMENEKGDKLLGLNDEMQNQVRAFIVDDSLKKYKEIQPTFLGKGTFTFSHNFAKPYTIFLFLEDNQTRSHIARTEVKEKKNEKNKEKPVFKIDPLLTSKIGPYVTSLEFNTLKPNRDSSLSFHFQTNGTKIRFQSPSGEPSRLIIMDREKQYLLTAVPSDVESSDRLQFSVTFSKEGYYKMWGEFYINGKAYKQSFDVYVAKQ